ncbi:hypothetical protein GCM10023187_52830 [Nibrella viscosa]|uniref:Uncharacterized protein n=1 Tax=Nibrella viscosa TaxID=1084524 RepID=A0ABP8KYX1_9BACT
MKSFFCLFIILLFVATRISIPSSSGVGSQGYYYAIVYKSNPAQAQFATTFLPTCNEGVLYQRIALYARKNGFVGYRLEGPFTQDEVEQVRLNAKQQWLARGYALTDDHNFIGNCY